MARRSPRRRDFTRHWVLTDSARSLARRLRRALMLPARLSAPAFAILLAALAWAGALGRPAWALGLALFMAGDWVMLALLPRLRRSFGPVQPAALVLALPRALCGMLPLVPAIVLESAGTLLAFYALWIEPHRVGLSRQSLRSGKLQPGAPLRVLHLSDLHVERVTDRERQVVGLVAAERPDLIVITGDLLNTSYVHDRDAWSACRWVLERLRAPLGVFLVSGSPPSDPDEVVAELVTGTELRWLRDERVTVRARGQSLEVIGLHCTHRPFLERPRLEALVGKPGAFTLLLYHAPDLAPDAAELGVDWMLCGHTHGGQVRLPWLGAVFTSSLYGKTFEMGRYDVDGMTLYVTRGLGMEGSAAPRVRLLCPPEAVLWEIDGEAEAGLPSTSREAAPIRRDHCDFQEHRVSP